MVKMSRLGTGIIKICQRKDYLFETLGGAVAAIVPKGRRNVSKYMQCAMKAFRSAMTEMDGEPSLMFWTTP